jgi:hypothetical protein
MDFDLALGRINAVNDAVGAPARRGEAVERLIQGLAGAVWIGRV